MLLLSEQFIAFFSVMLQVSYYKSTAMNFVSRKEGVVLPRLSSPHPLLSLLPSPPPPPFPHPSASCSHSSNWQYPGKHDFAKVCFSYANLESRMTTSLLRDFQERYGQSTYECIARYVLMFFANLGKQLVDQVECKSAYHLIFFDLKKFFLCLMWF